MTLSLYWSLLLVLDAILLFMGLHLIFGAISKELKGSTYHQARRCTGAAMCVTPLAGFLFYYLFTAYEEYYATAVNLTAFYLTMVLFTGAFLAIIEYRKEKLRKIIVTLIINFSIFLLPTWFPIWVGNMELLHIGHIVSNVFLGLGILLFGKYVFDTLKKTSKQMDNYYSDDITQHMHWIRRSLYLFAGLGVIACIAPFSNHYSLWMCLVYAFYQACSYVYIYNSVHRFECASLSFSLARETSVESLLPLYDVDASKTLNEATTLHIERQINAWVARGGHLEQGITAQEVATNVFTNRTYLSLYINSVYKLTFKEWIARLRINDSKKFLCGSAHFDLVDIASRVGFSSAKHFATTFKKVEGITPEMWHKKSASVKQPDI